MTQFSDTTNKNGLIQNIESLCKLGDAGISGNSTLLAKITGLINQANQDVAIALMQVDKRWQYEDFNNTDLPRAAATLVASQRDYTLPAASSSGNAATLLGIVKIVVLDANSTPQERVLVLTNKDEAFLNNHYSTSGLPLVYKLVGNSIKIWPAADSGANVTLASGLIIYFKRTPVAFTTSTTTTQPGFMAPFHDVLEFMVAGRHMLPIDKKLAESYLGMAEVRKAAMLEAYAHENEDSETKVVIKRRSSR